MVFPLASMIERPPENLSLSYTSNKITHHNGGLVIGLPVVNESTSVITSVVAPS